MVLMSMLLIPMLMFMMMLMPRSASPRAQTSRCGTANVFFDFATDALPLVLLLRWLSQWQLSSLALLVAQSLSLPPSLLLALLLLPELTHPSPHPHLQIGESQQRHTRMPQDAPGPPRAIF